MVGLFDEIYEQPDALHQTANRLAAQIISLQPYANQIKKGDIRRVVLTGMGGSFHALTPCLMMLIEQGISAVAIEASELVYYYRALLDAQTLLIVISQSGHSVEIVKLLDEVGKSTPTIGITNNPDSPLGQRSTTPLIIQAGAELTVSSKTYTCTLAALHILAAALTGADTSTALNDLHRAADSMQQYLPGWDQQAKTLVQGIEGVQFVTFLGRGISRASAMTAALITKETAKLPTEGMVGGQFRHGPMEVLAPQVAIFIFASSETTRELDIKLAADVAARAGHIIVAGAKAAKAWHIPLPDLNAAVIPIVEIVPVQLFAARLAEQRGLPVGQFRYGQKITTIE